MVNRNRLDRKNLTCRVRMIRLAMLMKRRLNCPVRINLIVSMARLEVMRRVVVIIQWFRLIRVLCRVRKSCTIMLMVRRKIKLLARVRRRHC